MKVIWCSTMGHCEVRDTAMPHVVIMEGPLTDVVPKLLESGKDVELRFHKGNNCVDIGYIELRYLWLSLCRDEDLFQKVAEVIRAFDEDMVASLRQATAINELRRAMSLRGRQI